MSRVTPSPRQPSGSGVRLVVSVLTGLLAGAVVALAGSWAIGGLVAWIVAATTFLLWTWISLWPSDAGRTAMLARREDPSRPASDLLLICVATASIIAVAIIIIPAGRTGWLLVALGISCIVVSWMVVHTVFMLKYARLYYTQPEGGIDFKQDVGPSYRDFAYLAFTVGMTFQVSDTDVEETEIRTTVLRQALISFLFGAIIIAVTINVIAGLNR
ncbi:MAG: DUF1345 domain-containing protein [Actinomycetota bacterium]|nr:DUF1345 domain-containing protein [Actinomycetota bacterium]